MQDEFAEARVWAFPELDDDYDDDDLLCGVCDEYDFPELSLEPMKVMPLPMTHQPQLHPTNLVHWTTRLMTKETC